MILLKRKALFKFQPFSPKQKAVLTWWMPDSPYCDKDGIILDGSIRSGKTSIGALSFVFWAMDTFDGQNFGMCGKTIQSFRRNVLQQLKRMLKSRGYAVEEHRSENYMIVRFKGNENTFYFFGGKDEGSQDLIQGITLAGLFMDEVALMPESFVNQATGRCSVEGFKLWFNCNPEGPDHYFKKEWIDKRTEKNLIRIHFEMKDNPSLSESMLEKYKNRYQGVFYERFILGLWVVAAGLIFRYFAENDAPYLFDDGDLYETVNGKRKRIAFSKLVMGIDFGGNGSKTTFALSGYRNGYKNIMVLEEDGLPITENIDANAICKKFIEFYKLCIEQYGRIDWVFPDSASTTMINSLRSAAKEAGLPYRNIKGCRKNEVSERPKTVDLLLNTGRLKIHKKCVNIRKAIGSIRWDEKKPDIPEDKNIGNINDWWDCFCYTWLDFVEYIDLKR